jgi:hypothetical protein
MPIVEYFEENQNHITREIRVDRSTFSLAAATLSNPAGKPSGRGYPNDHAFAK